MGIGILEVPVKMNGLTYGRLNKGLSDPNLEIDQPEMFCGQSYSKQKGDRNDTNQNGEDCDFPEKNFSQEPKRIETWRPKRKESYGRTFI